jgi:hypothetical protein
MRSEDVFAAAKKIGNRFLLCWVVSVSAHHLQAGPRPFTEGINKSLKLIAAMVPPAENGSVPGELRMSGDHLFPTPLREIKLKPLQAANLRAPSWRLYGPVKSFINYSLSSSQPVEIGAAFQQTRGESF